MVQEKTYKWIQARLREIDSGALSEKDLARLKEIAKGDPFVADALEGFHAHPNAGHADHLVAIEEKIKIFKRERRRWLVPNLAVTAIAACFLILIGGYAVIMRMDNTSEEKTFVLVEPDSILTMNESSEAIAMESNSEAEVISEDASNNAQDDVRGKMSEQKVMSAPPKTDNKVSSSRKEAQNKPNYSIDGVPVAAARAQAKEDFERKQPEAFKSRHIKGSIVDATTNKALAFSPYLLGHTNKLSFTDAKGQFEFDIREKYVVLNLKHAGYEERTITLPVTDENVVLDLTPKNGDEAKSASANSLANSDKNAAAYFAFRDYISSASLIPLGTGITSNGKTITIEFTVGQNGRPLEIKNVESTGDKKYVIEAQRLISTGPDWICPGGQSSCRRSYTFYFQ